MITNKPAATARQVGATVYFLRGNQAASGVVERTESLVTDENNDNTAEQVDVYFIVGDPKPYKSSEIYGTKNALDDAITAQLNAL